jgi:hypothetical protein
MQNQQSSKPATVVIQQSRGFRRGRQGPNRGNSNVSGGSGDIRPQLMAFNAVESGADATTTLTVPIANNLQTIARSSRPMLFEILKVWWSNNSGAEVDSNVIGILSTVSFGTTAPSHADPRILALYKEVKQVTTSGIITSGVVEQDLTDGAGNGPLVASNNLYCQVSSGTTSGTITVTCRILYRWCGSTLTEVFGIAQSQS